MIFEKKKIEENVEFIIAIKFIKMKKKSIGTSLEYLDLFNGDYIIFKNIKEKEK